MTAESLSVARAQRVNRNIFGTFFNVIENMVTESNLSGTSENVSKLNRNHTQVNNSNIVIIDKGTK